MKETSQKILDVQTEMAALKLFILEQCFIIKQNLKLNCDHSLNAESSGDDRELINALLRQIKYLKMELDKKKYDITCNQNKEAIFNSMAKH